MKKTFLSLIIALSLYGASAQTSFSPATGSVINAGSDTLHVSVPGYQAVVGIQFIAKKDSGTVGGAAVLYGTIDGQNYVSTGDTLILADVPTNTAI